MEDHLNAIIDDLAALDRDERIEALNAIRARLHDVSPLRNEPIDLVTWVREDRVTANDYNPNTVAPPEMKLLELSIGADGYTQPVVSSREGDCFHVVDGFHRSKVGRASAAVQARTGGYLPVTVINADRVGRRDRMASTIRHNRARGKHGVEAMSSIVIELARRNWNDKKIARELGMEADEVLRLKQIGGLADVFANREFSEAWDIEENARD